MKISFIIPSRNNKKYLEWAYSSIRKNQGNHEVEICVADDFSKDGTKEWCEEIVKADKQFKWIRNEGPERQGLVILNDRLINEVATNDICMIYHADMYLAPGALDAIEKNMYGKELTEAERGIIFRADALGPKLGFDIVDGKPVPPIKTPTEHYNEYNVPTHKPNEKTIVSLTRIEPPLHPDGPEKCIWDCGIEPEEFDEDKLLKFVKGEGQVFKFPEGHTTEGIFAPWAFWKKDFQEIGGHDILFAPQSKEDSDIFNRFHLNGIKFIQTWEGFVYHMTSRGSRFNPLSGGAPGKDSPEWVGTTTRNMREFIRKWGHAVKHDQYLKPIVPPKYDIGFVIKNCNNQLLEALEPWCNRVYSDQTTQELYEYGTVEWLKTSFNIHNRVVPINIEPSNGILVKIDGDVFRQEDFRNIQILAEIIQDSGEVGEFELGNLKITINNLTTYEKKLICNITS